MMDPPIDDRTTAPPQPGRSGSRAPAIRTERLSKRFGPAAALEDVGVTVPDGAIYALLGPNGAGKSTMVNLLVGLLLPTAGTVAVLGVDPGGRGSRDLRQRIGVVPEGAPLFEPLTGREHLQFCGDVHGVRRPALQERIEALLSLTELAKDADRQVSGYSTGMRKKLALCCALIHGPELLLLDEPFENLDPGSARVVRETLLRVREAGTTLLITSHDLEVIERLASHVGILVRGRLLLEGELTSLLRGRRLEDLYFDTVGTPSAGATGLGWFGRQRE
jgi:ABC-2 type transport system ATP-binding protein